MVGFSINNSLSLDDQLQYSNNIQFGSSGRDLPENASNTDFFNIYSQEMKNYKLRSDLNDGNNGLSIRNISGGAILDSFVNNQFVNSLDNEMDGIDFLPFNQGISVIEDLGQKDFLDSIKLMEELQDKAALIGKNTNIELNNEQVKNDKAEKVVIDNLIPYIIVSDGRLLKINEVQK